MTSSWRYYRHLKVGLPVSDQVAAFNESAESAGVLKVKKKICQTPGLFDYRAGVMQIQVFAHNDDTARTLGFCRACFARWAEVTFIQLFGGGLYCVRRASCEDFPVGRTGAGTPVARGTCARAGCPGVLGARVTQPPWPDEIEHLGLRLAAIKVDRSRARLCLVILGGCASCFLNAEEDTREVYVPGTAIRYGSDVVGDVEGEALWLPRRTGGWLFAVHQRKVRWYFCFTRRAMDGERYGRQNHRSMVEKEYRPRRRICSALLQCGLRTGRMGLKSWLKRG